MTAAAEVRHADVTAAPGPQRQAEVAQRLRAVLPAHCVLWRAEDTRPYECDRLSAFRQLPMVVALPESEAQQLVDPLSGRYWKIVNPTVSNSLGEPVAYKLMPGENVRAFALPESSIAKRAAFMTKHLWVTPYAPDEIHAAGAYPNQHPGGARLPTWTAADRLIAVTDVVLWYTFGAHHIVRPEDWPVMPVNYIGFMLKPIGFFDCNPALDVPPPAGHDGHCHV